MTEYLVRRTIRLMDAYRDYSEKVLDNPGMQPVSHVEIASVARTSLMSAKFMHGMSIAFLLDQIRNGDETSWAEEFDWLLTNHEKRMNEIVDLVQLGKTPPVDICFNEMRMVDGHHRLLAHMMTGRTMIPVCDAWHKG